MIEYWDWGNAFFEGVGSLVIWLNVRRLYIDKMVAGMDWRVTVFFTAWGFFNMGLYPALGLWWSFVAGIGIAVANCVWVFMVVHYNRINRRMSTPTAGAWL